jgi:hypothetical protein
LFDFGNESSNEFIGFSRQGALGIYSNNRLGIRASQMNPFVGKFYFKAISLFCGKEEYFSEIFSRIERISVFGGKLILFFDIKTVGVGFTQLEAVSTVVPDGSKIEQHLLRHHVVM